MVVYCQRKFLRPAILFKIIDLYSGEKLMKRFVFAVLAAFFISSPASAGDVGQKYTRYDDTGSYQSTERDFDYRAAKLNKADIKDIQEALNEAGYTPGPVDGVVGPLTRKGVKEFQKHRKLPVTGVIDGATLRKLKVHSWRNYDHRDSKNYN
jgi:hypothetical protein